MKFYSSKKNVPLYGSIIADVGQGGGVDRKHMTYHASLLLLPVNEEEAAESDWECLYVAVLHTHLSFYFIFPLKMFSPLRELLRATFSFLQQIIAAIFCGFPALYQSTGCCFSSALRLGLW